MRTPRAPIAARRLGSCGPVLGALAATTLIAATLIATLASFAGQALPAAARHRLATSPGTTIAVNGAFGSALAHTDAFAVRKAVRSALGAVPFTMYGSLWSDSLGLPASYGKSPVPLIQAASPEAFRSHVALTAGTWPGSPRRGQPIPAAVPSSVAARLKLRTGDIVPVRDRNNGAHLRLRIAGLFRPIEPTAPYWTLDLVGTTGENAVGGFVTYGPAIVSPMVFGSGLLNVGAASWAVIPQVTRIGDRSLRPAASKVAKLESSLENSPSLGGLQVTTNLPGVLTDLASNLVVARSLLVIGALQVLLLAMAAIMLATRLLAGQRVTESALVSARGGSRWQLARLDAAEVVPIALVSAALGGLLARPVAALIAREGPLGQAGLRAPGTSASLWWAAGAAAAFCAAAALVPSLRPVTPGEARVGRGRQAAVAGVIRAGGDVALIGLAVLAVWQLRTYSAMTRTVTGGIGIDPVLAAAPAVAVAGGAVGVMRLLPMGTRAADRLASRGRRLLGALATWEISRRPIRQGGPALIMVLAVATGTLVFAERASWQRSARDQAAFATGSDIRARAPAPASAAQVGDISGAGAMAVARISSQGSGVVLAIDTRKAPATVLLRPDLSPAPAPSLWRRLFPTRSGVAVPGRPARLEIVASMGPASLRLGQAQVSLSVQDAAGVAYTVPAGTLTADDRAHMLTAAVAPGGHAAYPLRLIALHVVYTVPAAMTRNAVLTIGAFAAHAVAGRSPPPFATGNALRGWSRTVTSADLIQAEQPYLTTPGVTMPAVARWSTTSSGAQSLAFSPGHGRVPLTPGAPPVAATGQVDLTAGTPGAPAIPPIPGIATRAYLTATKATVGTTVTTAINGVKVPVRIVASLDAFPTVTDPGGALILDQATVQEVMAAQSADPLPVSEWWIRARRAGTTRPAGVPAGSAITFRANLAARLLANPVSSVPQQALLAIAVAAGLLAAVGFSVSVAASATEKRTQNAVLAALGLSRAERARLLCLEELMLSIPSAAAGLVLGAVLARLLIPAITLTSSGTAPVPPVISEIAWPLVAGLAAAVAMVPVLAAAATVARRPDPAAQLRAAEAG